MNAASTGAVAIVLAAGKGTRMKSDRPKVLFDLLGKPMVVRVLEQLQAAGVSEMIVVVGYGADEVKAAVEALSWSARIQFVHQDQQLGTGHAVAQAQSLLSSDDKRPLLITCGDMPLVPASRYRDLLAVTSSTSSLTVVTVAMQHPTGYGRLMINASNQQLERIVEEKDATEAERAVQWINTGIYATQWATLQPYLTQLSTHNAQGEFYLTDVVGLMHRDQRHISVNTWPDEHEIMGINDRHHLSQATQWLSLNTIDRLSTDGVTVLNPSSQLIAPEVQMAPDTVIMPGCVMLGDIRIGSGCQIGPYSTLTGTIHIGDNCRVTYSVLDKHVTVANDSAIGPFAHCRDNAHIGHHVKVGNFVEMKETQFGDYANAAHLCYLGDVDVGDYVNMGAGSIIANYDPIRDSKTRSTLGKHVKVGCNSVIVSPVVIEEGACVAAGSVITERVNAWDLAIARCRQSNVQQWVKKILDGVKA